jgi:hypothetical protein
MDDIPPTEAELAAEGDALARWERNMPRPEPKRKPVTQLSLADVDARIADERAYMDQLLVGIIAELQHMFNEKLKHFEQKLQQLETALQVEQKVNARMAQVEQRYQREQRHVINGHA